MCTRYVQVLTEIYATHTGKDIETLEKDMDRDNFMTPTEAVEYGLADEVVAKRGSK